MSYACSVTTTRITHYSLPVIDTIIYFLSIYLDVSLCYQKGTTKNPRYKEIQYRLKTTPFTRTSGPTHRLAN
jgi:hypothetical protein